MNEEIANKIKEIKKSFPLYMNGVASHSMRQKGTEYKINWGISIPQIKEIATKYGKDKALAIQLWKENIRECKILATLIMPAEEMSEDLASIWIEDVNNQELAEILSFNLLKNTPIAQKLSFQLIASGQKMKQICGFQILAGFFSIGNTLEDRDIDEYIDQSKAVMNTEDQAVKHAAIRSIYKFCELNEKYEKLISKTFQGII